MKHTREHSNCVCVILNSPRIGWRRWEGIGTARRRPFWTWSRSSSSSKHTSKPELTPSCHEPPTMTSATTITKQVWSSCDGSKREATSLLSVDTNKKKATSPTRQMLCPWGGNRRGETTSSTQNSTQSTKGEINNKIGERMKNVLWRGRREREREPQAP